MLTNIGHVTETLKSLIDSELRVNGAQLFSVSAAPPDASTFPTGRVVSIYLFHVMESPDLKNLPSRSGTSAVPVQQEPMGLILQYIVTVVAAEETDITDSETIEQQKLIGFIARAIHDFPIVSDKTQILVPGETDPTLILHAGLRGTQAVLRFNLRPASMEETVTFWTAQDKNVPRLSLFVEARVVVLEPKPPEVAPGIVLSVGQFVFTSGEPQLVASRNTTFFLPPNSLEPSSVRPSPARVAVFDAPPAASLAALAARHPNLLENNRLAIEAVGLAPGKRILVLRNSSGSIRIALDQALADVPPTNQPWELEATSSGVSLRIFRRVIDAEGTLRDVFPGAYGVRVIVLDDRALGAARPRSSNELGITIIPQILSVAPTTGPSADTNLYTLTLVSPSLSFRAELAFSVGGRSLRAVQAGTPGVGEYRVLFGPLVPPDSNPSPASQIQFRLPLVDPAAATPVPIQPSALKPLAVRLVVDGATATPDWLTVPAP